MGRDPLLHENEDEDVHHIAGERAQKPYCEKHLLAAFRHLVYPRGYDRHNEVDTDEHVDEPQVSAVDVGCIKDGRHALPDVTADAACQHRHDGIEQRPHDKRD